MKSESPRLCRGESEHVPRKLFGACFAGARAIIEFADLADGTWMELVARGRIRNGAFVAVNNIG